MGALTAREPRLGKAEDGTTFYQVGASRFRSLAIAEKAAQTRATFAAAVNREGMTGEDRAAAIAAFFSKAGR